MLPILRQSDYLSPFPLFDLDKNDVNDFLRELKGYHENFEDCFKRVELKKHFYWFMVGQFSELERKSIEPIALNLEDGKVRAMQRFVSTAKWDDNKILNKHHELVKEDLGSPDGALVFDESGFIKKGRHSIGVARQYSGTIGKVENCQVGVFSTYVSSKGYSFLDKRLYIPLWQDSCRMV